MSEKNINFADPAYQLPDCSGRMDQNVINSLIAETNAKRAKTVTDRVNADELIASISTTPSRGFWIVAGAGTVDRPVTVRI